MKDKHIDPEHSSEDNGKPAEEQESAEEKSPAGNSAPKAECPCCGSREADGFETDDADTISPAAPPEPQAESPGANPAETAGKPPSAECSCSDWGDEVPAAERFVDNQAADNPSDKPPADAASHDALFENYDESRPMVALPQDALELNPQMDKLKGIIESVLFVADAPVTLKKLCDAIPDYAKKDITVALAELRTDYIRSGKGFLIEEIAGGYQMLSNPENIEYVRRLHEKETSSKLTPAMLETLAIIAYKQPVMRADIEAIRGVQVGPIVRSLMEKGMVRVAGRAAEAGKPFLYGTTKQFLEHFGLRSIEDLPKIEELKPPPD
jgi:segregation and condensation protein B